MKRYESEYDQRGNKIKSNEKNVFNFVCYISLYRVGEGNSKTFIIHFDGHALGTSPTSPFFIYLLHANELQLLFL